MLVMNRNKGYSFKRSAGSLLTGMKVSWIKCMNAETNTDNNKLITHNLNYSQHFYFKCVINSYS